jgi:hypothetical protein
MYVSCTQFVYATVIKRAIPKDVRWADFCDDEDEKEEDEQKFEMKRTISKVVQWTDLFDNKDQNDDSNESKISKRDQIETKIYETDDTYDVLISTKKKVKFTQIHGKGFSIGSRADGEVSINGQKVVSDAKRSELLAKGSFLQLILYGYSYRRKYAMVVHTTKVEEERKTGLSILCTILI